MRSTLPFAQNLPYSNQKDEVALPPSSPLRHLLVCHRLEAPMAEQALGILASLQPAISEPPLPAGAGRQRRELIHCILSDILKHPRGIRVVIGSWQQPLISPWPSSCCARGGGRDTVPKARSLQGSVLSFPVLYFIRVLTHGLSSL